MKESNIYDEIGSFEYSAPDLSVMRLIEGDEADLYKAHKPVTNGQDWRFNISDPLYDGTEYYRGLEHNRIIMGGHTGDTVTGDLGGITIDNFPKSSQKYLVLIYSVDSENNVYYNISGNVAPKTGQSMEGKTIVTEYYHANGAMIKINLSKPITFPSLEGPETITISTPTLTQRSRIVDKYKEGEEIKWKKE